MMAKTKNKLPYGVIEAAVSGNIEAINVVLKHYERYIVVLSTRKLYDENGSTHLCVDNELKRRLETKLITKILEFKKKNIGFGLSKSAVGNSKTAVVVNYNGSIYFNKSYLLRGYGARETANNQKKKTVYETALGEINAQIENLLAKNKKEKKNLVPRLIF